MSTNQERTTDTERKRETFTRFFEEAEPRLRVALGAALGQDRGRDAASEALAFGWENWDRLEQMENPIGYLYRVGRSSVRERKQRFLRPVPDEGFPHIEPGLPVALEQLSDSQRVAVVTTDPVKIEEIFDPGVVIVGPGGSRSERDDTMLTQERQQQTPPSRFRGPRIAAAAAIAAVVVAIGLFAIGGGDGDPLVATTDPPVTTPPTTAAQTTAPPTTQAPVTPSSPAELATASLDTLLEAFNNEDSDAVQSYFGESVVFTTSAQSGSRWS